MFQINYDEARHIVDIKTWGYISLEEYPRYAADFRKAASEARRRNGDIRVFIDAREGAVLAPAIAGRIAQMKREILSSDGDRLAIVVHSSVQKLQIRSITTSQRTQSFLSVNAARTWLMAYAELRGAA